MSQINFGEVLGKVGRGIAEGCKIALCMGLISLPYLSMSTTKKITYYGDVGYDDAIKALMSCSMYSHEKTAAIELIKQNADTTYYNAVISIITSNMYSHEKVDAIRKISK